MTEATDGPWMAIEGTVATIIQDVCELPGDTADDHPDRLVCTVDELRIIVERALEAALPPPPPVVQELMEALGWLLAGDRDVSGQALVYSGHWEEIGARLDRARALLTRVKGGE